METNAAFVTRWLKTKWWEWSITKVREVTEQAAKWNYTGNHHSNKTVNGIN